VGKRLIQNGSCLLTGLVESSLIITALIITARSWHVMCHTGSVEFDVRFAAAAFCNLQHRVMLSCKPHTCVSGPEEALFNDKVMITSTSVADSAL
jgi:hypothetical protein